jgi:hypothetical protein
MSRSSLSVPGERRGLAVLLVLVSVAIGLCSCGGSAGATAQSIGPASGGVAISPQSGTPDASPGSQISFLGPNGTQIANVSVVGSRSGNHTGRLLAYSTGTGESFVPSKPFLQGERVNVHAIATAGGSSQTLSSSFTIAHQASYSKQPFPNNAGDSRAVQHYRSAPTLTPSTVRITTPAKPGASPGDLFLAPYQGTGSPGPMIVRQDGQLVWFHPLPAGDSATNFQVQQYEGKPVLSWWQGKILGVGFGQGEDLIYNSAYEKVAQVKAGNGYHADLHEIHLTPQGTAWIDIFDPIHTSLSAAKGPSSGVLTDSVVQEIDIKTGLVMWEWHALGHISIADSFNPIPSNGRPWDYVHINSVNPGASGDVLLSGRNTWTLYDVNLSTGAFNWTLGGGKHSSFRLGGGVKFYWQHDAEFQPGGLISVFDNASDPPKEKQSRGLLLSPNLSNHTVSLVKQFVNPKATLLAESQANMLNLSSGNTSGNWLLGYGRLPNFTEFDSAGHVLLDGTLGKNVQDFRTYLSPWSGQPKGSPSLAAQTSSSGVTIEASWNGATNVASWQALEGSSPTSLTPVGSPVPSSGFETTLHLGAELQVAVRALDGAGQTLATSSAIATASK